MTPFKAIFFLGLPIVLLCALFFLALFFLTFGIFFFLVVWFCCYFKKNKGREKRDEKNEKNSEIRAAPVGTGTWKNVVVANCKRNGTYFLLLYYVGIFIANIFFAKYQSMSPNLLIWGIN